MQKPLKRLVRYGTECGYTAMNRGVGLSTDEINTISSGVRPLTEIYYGDRDRESKAKLLQQFSDGMRLNRVAVSAKKQRALPLRERPCM